jgi:hypothetical protein
LTFNEASRSINASNVEIVGTLSRETSSITPRTGTSGQSSMRHGQVTPERGSWAKVARA